MTLTIEQKRGLLWALGVATAVTLATLAWHQINAALTHCFLFV